VGLQTHRQKKRFVGRLKSGVGFDFCGYQFSRGQKLRVSAEGRRRHLQRRARLKEQGAFKTELRAYDKRWSAWCHGGLWGLVVEKGVG